MTARSTAGGIEAWVPTAPESLPTAACSNAAAEAAEVAVGLEREAGEPEPERGRLGVDAVRAPDAEGLRVLAGAGDQRVAVGGRALDEDRARLDELQRERGVEDVGGGEAVVDPAAVLADRCRDDVDERGDVVVGRPLALLDRLDRELAPARARRLAASAGTRPSAAQASVAASSTSSQPRIRRSSVQTAPISSRVYRARSSEPAHGIA